MTVKWGSYLLVVGCLILLIGCRTPQPNLKPEKSPEVLTPPPQEARFETTGYPKQAFDTIDPNRITNLDKTPGQASSGRSMMPSK